MQFLGQIANRYFIMAFLCVYASRCNSYKLCMKSNISLALGSANVINSLFNSFHLLVVVDYNILVINMLLFKFFCLKMT